MATALLAPAAACLVIWSGAAAAETLRFTAALSSEVTIPPRPSAGQGTATLSLDTATKTLSWAIEYSGLPVSPKAVGCGVLDGSGGPAIIQTTNLASPVRGSKVLNDADITELKAGNWTCVIDSDGESGEIAGEVQPAR